MNKWPHRVQVWTLAAFVAAGFPLTGQAADASPTTAPGAIRASAAGFVHRSDIADALVFDNGDVLYGDLRAIDAGRVQWQRSDAVSTLEFEAAHVTEVLFRQWPASPRVTIPTCRVRLTNEDELEGQFVSMDADHVVLETWYAGRLAIPRPSIQVFLPLPPKGKTVFAGPTGLEGWTVGKVRTPGTKGGEWRYKDGAFYAAEAASIARDIQLPDVASLQFDIVWKGTLYLAVALYTDYLQPVSLASKETEPLFGGFYSLQINSYSVNLLPVTQKDPLRPLGQVMVPNFSRANRSHIEIRVDKPKRLIALLVDGAAVKQWIDPERFVGAGRAVRLVHQGQGSVRLNHLEVTEWDGQFEEPLALSPGGALDQVKLRDGGKVVGNLQAIREGQLAIATVDSTIAIPFSRVKQIELAAGKPAPAPSTSTPDTVRAFFPNGAGVSLNLERWEQGGIVARSAVLGPIRFEPSAFARMVFLTHPTLKN